MTIDSQFMITTTSTIAFGALVQSCLGFGMALVAVPFLLMIDSRLVPIPLIIVSMINCAWNWLRFRDQAVLRSIWIALLGRIPGTVLAIVTIKFATEKQISLICALLVLIAVGVSFIASKIPVSNASSFYAGGASGFMGTISGIGGPPMALLYQNEPADRARGTMGAFFTFGCIISLIGHEMAGNLHLSHWADAAMLLPGTILGTFLAKFAAPYLQGEYFRKAILTTCTLAATFTLIKSLH